MAARKGKAAEAAPNVEPYTIPRRFGWSNLPPITVEITCEAGADARVKLGLAVKVAHSRGADLTDADLRGAVLTDADLTDAVLTDAVLRGADLTGASLRGAVLRTADLRGAVLRTADLTDADLRGAVLRDADLTDAVLRGAVLRDADLRDAVLRGAVLRGADLTDAVLRDAVLTDAVLTDADLTDAVLRGEKIKRLLALAGRLDGYTFYGFELAVGGVKIAAGCRWFTPSEFRAHVAAAYPGTLKAAETLSIIEHIERTASALGVAS